MSESPREVSASPLLSSATSSSKPLFKAFNVLFDNEGVFAPGETITGKIVVHPLQDVQISPIRLSFRGFGALCDPNDEALLQTIRYFDKSVELGISISELKGGEDHTIVFQEPLPLNLETSIESRSLTITYSLKARFTYRTPENTVCPLATTRGFTVIAPIHLDFVDSARFKSSSYSVSKKYGFLPCTSGHISLKIDAERTAYLCGESLVLEGYLENDSNRRVDNVVGVLQKVVEVMRYATNSSNVVGSCEKPQLATISTEVINIKKDNLAMYIDPRTTTKITRNFAVPTCRPSTSDLIQIGDYSVLVSYRLVVKVKQINEICSLSVPLFIGTVPHKSCHNKKTNPWVTSEYGMVREESGNADEERQRARYQRDPSERQCSLYESGEAYLSKRTRMIHINLYPYFPYLSTSSKQSRQFKMIASAVRAENKFMARFRSSNNDLASASTSKLDTTAPKEDSPKELTVVVEPEGESFDSLGELKPENLIRVQPAVRNNPFVDLVTKASSTISLPKFSSFMPAKRHSLPPVEISVTDSISSLKL